MPQLQSLHALEILDSRGNPTIAVTARTEGFEATAMVPSGASTGKFEAVELRDGDKARFAGKGVLKAVLNVNSEINNSLRGQNVFDQQGVDSRMIELDGTENKGRLGANAILGVSLAIAKVAAKEKKKELFDYLAEMSGTVGTKDLLSLPSPMMNVINGGAHADNTLDFQEFMLVPQAPTFAERLRIGAETFQVLKRLLQEKNMSTAVGDEGGFAPDLRTHEDALSLMSEATKIAGHEKRMAFALDPAASEFYNEELKVYEIEGGKVTAEQLIDYYAYLCDKYPIISIEDPLHEGDWENWVKLTAKLGGRLQVVGDDLLVTNTERIKKAIEMKACNAVLIKLNQIGTLTETIEAIKMAQLNGMGVVVSHRSGETEDTSIADLSVGLAVGQIKTGSLSRSERTAKYNRLLVIEEKIG